MPVTNGSPFLDIKKNFQAASTGSLNFPSTLSSYPFWMTFAFYQYRRPSSGGDTSLTSRFATKDFMGPLQDTSILNQGAIIRLPLPNQMVDHQDVVYTPEEAGLVAGAAINQFVDRGSGVEGALAGIATGAAGAAVGADRLLKNKYVNLASQLGGVAVNPFLTVMFKSPSFKKHQFSWRLSPTNEKESITLNNIIRTLRVNQLPDSSQSLGGALLTYPNIVQINVSNPDSFDYRFKPAVIETLSINFTPGGQPSFFGSTKTPTEIEIRISLLEIEYYLQRDYGVRNTAGVQLGADIEKAVGKAIDGVKSAAEIAANAAQ